MLRTRNVSSKAAPAKGNRLANCVLIRMPYSLQDSFALQIPTMRGNAKNSVNAEDNLYPSEPQHPQFPLSVKPERLFSPKVLPPYRGRNATTLPPSRSRVLKHFFYKFFTRSLFT